MGECRSPRSRCVDFVVLLSFCVIILLLQGCGNVGARGTTPNTSTSTTTGSTTITSNPAISNASLPEGSVGIAYSATLAASGGTAPYTWSIAASPLPGGLTLAATTGQISGMPTTSGSFNVTFTVTDKAGGTASKSLSIAIAASATLAVVTTSVPTATTGTAYSVNLTATGGVSPDTWSVTSGTLPSGVTLAANGQLSGTASAAGSFSFTATVTDSASQAASQALVLIVVAPNTPGSSDGPATLPLTFINTKFTSQPNATVYSVNAGDATDLQTKINTAAANCAANGAVVNVPAGATYTAPQYFNLPATNCTGGARVVIESASLSSLPAQGTRVSASNANMPTLTNAQASISYPVIMAADNPSNPPAHYWLAGLEVTSNYPSSGGPEIALLVLGDYCNQIGGGGCPITAGMSAANLANDFTVDRCWIHGANASSDVLHGIRFTASNIAVEDSVISDIHDSQANPGQSTGISSDFTMGPVDVGNTEVAAVTENIIFGGTDPTITNSVPSDIYIHHNYVHKLTSWLTANAGTYQNYMRNFVECKNCQRVLVEGNTFDTAVGNSLSASVQMTPRNANGKCTWCVVQDVTVRYNHFSNIADWISFLGANGNTGGGSLGPELPFKRGSIHDNLVENLNDSVYGANGRWIQINAGDASSTGCSATANSAPCQLSDLTITHNSLVSGQATSATNTFWTLAGTPAAGSLGYNVVITNNIVPAGASGFASDAGSAHPLTGFLNAQFSSYTFNNNVITGATTTGYSCTDFPSPIQNFCGTIGQPAAMANVLFTNYNNGLGGDYHLQASSPYKNQASDGTDPGANSDLVNSFTSGSLTGLGNTPQALAISTLALPAAVANSGYSVNLTATGGTQPYSWSISSGTLPAGLSLNASTGVISGSTTVVGSTSLTVQVTDSASHSVAQSYTLVVGLASSLVQSASQTTGVDERGNNYAQVAFPGFAQVRVSDGAAEIEGYRSGLSVFWDLKNDPTALHPIEGQDCGLGLGVDYAYPANGVLLGSAESKCSPGTITVLENNNIRLVVSYDWVNTESGPTGSCAGSKATAQCIATPGFTGHYIYTIYRAATGGAKVYGRISFTNSTGTTINMDSTTCPSGQFCDFQYNFAQSWTDFAGEGLQYPPDIGIGYSDPYWQTNGGYAPKTPSPWGWGSDDETNQTNIHFLMHSTGIPTAPRSGLSITDGTTTFLNSSTVVPVKASFLEITNDNGGTPAGYILQPFAGARSKIQVSGITIPSNGPDSLLRYAFWLGGDNGVVQESDATPYAAEFRTPPLLTMIAGTSQGFQYDRGEFQLTASSNTVDFTTAGVMHSPEFTIANWTTTAPATIRLNGATLSLNVDYVAIAASGTLELQVMRQLNTNDHVQIP